MFMVYDKVGFLPYSMVTAWCSLHCDGGCSNMRACYEELPALHAAGLAAVGLGQRRYVQRVVHHERRLHKSPLHQGLEHLVQDDAHTGRLCGCVCQGISREV